MTTVLTVLLVIAILLLVILLILQLRTASAVRDAAENETDIADQINGLQIALIKELNQNEIRSQKNFLDHFLRLNESIVNDMEKSARSRERIEETIRSGLVSLQETTDRKLAQIQLNVNQKLDQSLNERLDANFRQVSEQLASLYQSLGELKRLESGVQTLNRTLANAKTRGVFGEMQLGSILANVLDSSQYECNISTRPHSQDFVEYAVKIPDKENQGGFIYLPIDSKFPSDLYHKLIDAEDAASAEAAKRELKVRIRTEAATIRDKYIAVPYTTDFAILFLPTESLYAEVLRIDGLAEDCQTRCKVLIAGPATLTALLNSLSVGFKYLTVNKKAEEILKTLGAFKTQFEKYDDLIRQTQKSLALAQTKTDKIQQRNEMIRRSLRKIDALDYGEADAWIEAEPEDDIPDEGPAEDE